MTSIFGTPFAPYFARLFGAQFSTTVPPGLRRRLPDADLWRQTASELRRLGFPCLIAPTLPSDGVGSSTIRHLASWIFAEQMGCDWVTPDWGKRRADAGNGTTSTVLYCHRTATTQEVATGRPSEAVTRCSVVDWLSYFQLDLPSVSLPEERSLKVIEVRTCASRRGPRCKGCTAVFVSKPKKHAQRGRGAPVWLRGLSRRAPRLVAIRPRSNE